MNIKLSLVTTTALAFGVALLMLGVLLPVLGAPGAVRAAPTATIQSMIDAAPTAARSASRRGRTPKA